MACQIKKKPNLKKTKANQIFKKNITEFVAYY